jgi:hypothetical protein
VHHLGVVHHRFQVPLACFFLHHIGLNKSKLAMGIMAELDRAWIELPREVYPKEDNNRESLIWEASDLATTILRHDGFMDDEVE